MCCMQLRFQKLFTDLHVFDLSHVPYSHVCTLIVIIQCHAMFSTQTWQHSAVETLPKVFIWRTCLLSLLCTRLFACLLGCSQLTLAAWAAIWWEQWGWAPADSALRLTHNRSAWSASPLGAPGSAPCHLWPNRSARPSQHGDQGSASKASCPLPATWCSISDKGYISFPLPPPSIALLRTG